MTLISTFIVVLARILNLAILVRILLSWIPMGGSSRIITLIYEITEPILGPVRRLIPPLGGLDISPMIALILIEILERVLLTIVARVG
jgi:YggT family protein